MDRPGASNGGHAVIGLIGALSLFAFLVSWPLTLVIRTISRRIGALDTDAITGQIKAARRTIPNTGGVAIALTFLLPLTALALGTTLLGDAAWLPDSVRTHLPGLLTRRADLLWLLGCVTAIHLLGLIDDRRPLGPLVKLLCMLGLAAAVSYGTQTRTLTLLDGVAGGTWLSLLVTTIWIAVVTNALNFMDNSDGLSAGVGVIVAGCLLAAALSTGQWFVAACLALLIGGMLGFLVFNFPPASIFMGDSGSLVIGFLLAFLSIRITYTTAPSGTLAAWSTGDGTLAGPGSLHAVLTPLVVLAVPIYDFLSVTIIRLSAGRSPFVGDLNHLSHRLRRRGLTSREMLMAVYGFTAVTALGGISLMHTSVAGAITIGVQTVLLLAVIALLEYAADPPTSAHP